MKHSADMRLGSPPLVVQILTIIGYTGFAIPVSIVAMDQFGVLGLALAAFIAYQYSSVVGFGSKASVSEIVEALGPRLDMATGRNGADENSARPSGNASFDAYRNELIDRLEQEQSSFESFLERLRAAKDKSEFEQFMSDRERRSAPQLQGT
ncbi:MAG: DUF2852 domain-containing protein [Pseudomonadota bacterium]